MRDAKSCPVCGFLLRFEDPPDSSFSAPRHLAVELLFWAALALFLAFLWATADSRELYAALAFAALIAWAAGRGRQQAAGNALLARRQYHCAKCKRNFAGQDLDASPS